MCLGLFWRKSSDMTRALTLCFGLIAGISFLSAQTDCEVFNVQALSAAYVELDVDTVLLQPDGSYEIELTNGNVVSMVLGCTNEGYFEYDAAANVDDGSCAVLIVPGCTDPSYTEYHAGANVDDGSCETYDPTCTAVAFGGHSYNVTYIGGQCWFAENLRTAQYANGNSIPGNYGPVSWSTSTSYGVQAVQGDDDANIADYGRLYNSHAMLDERNVCPTGWKVPSDEEWDALLSNVGENPGLKLKSSLFWNGTSSGTNEFDFDARPGGYRFSSGSYYGTGGLGDYWSTTTWRQFNSSNEVSSNSIGTVYAEHGFSIRCLKDGDIQGCTDPAYIEFNPAANADDGSCLTQE